MPAVEADSTSAGVQTDTNDVQENHFEEICQEEVRETIINPGFLCVIEGDAENEEDGDTAMKF